MWGTVIGRGHGSMTATNSQLCSALLWWIGWFVGCVCENTSVQSEDIVDQKTGSFCMHLWLPQMCIITTKRPGQFLNGTGVLKL